MTDEPKIEEPKDVRLPFMVTASEAKAIDEWRYANHIPSRAEAMRLLINRGLVFDRFDDASFEITRVLNKLLTSAEMLNDSDIITLTKAVQVQDELSNNASVEINGVLEQLLKDLEKPQQD